MKRLFLALISILSVIILSETAAAQKYTYNVLYAVKTFEDTDNETDLNDKYLEINIIKGISNQLPLMKITLAKSSSSTSLTDVMWFEKGKSYYYILNNDLGKFYCFYSTEFKREGINIYIPKSRTDHGMVQFVHVKEDWSDKLSYSIAAYISYEDAIRIENIVKQQITNLNIKYLK